MGSESGVLSADDYNDDDGQGRRIPEKQGLPSPVAGCTKALSFGELKGATIVDKVSFRCEFVNSCPCHIS